MMKCLAKFAMRVSRSPGSCSAVKLKYIRPIPINTTANRSIVPVIRDRIRLSSAQVTSRGVRTSSLQLNDRTREYKLLKSLHRFRRLCLDRALSINARPAIATARHFGDPESAINFLGAPYPESELLCAQCKTEIAKLNSLCRNNNAEANRSRDSSQRQPRHALVTIVTESYTLTHGSAQRLDKEDAEESGAAVFDDEKRLENRLLI